MTRHRNRRGFTLVELLVSMAILSLILVLVLAMVNSITTLWKGTTGKISAFQQARAGFEAVTRKISQSTLNTYWDYTNTQSQTRTDYFKANPTAAAGSFVPDKYARASELHFVSGPADTLLAPVKTAQPAFQTNTHAIFFQAPLGYSVPPAATDVSLQDLLNATGFFIQLTDDSANRPKFLNSLLPTRTRFMLMELWQPTELLNIYATTGNSWFTTPLLQTPSPARPIAENIVALLVWPKRAKLDTGTALTTDYRYDTRKYLTSPSDSLAKLTRNQLPPVLQVTMVAIDEASASRLKAADYTEIQAALANLFQDTSKYESDLVINAQNPAESLEELLVRKKLAYRVFTTNVTIKQAKWSEEN